MIISMRLIFSERLRTALDALALEEQGYLKRPERSLLFLIEFACDACVGLAYLGLRHGSDHRRLLGVPVPLASRGFDQQNHKGWRDWRARQTSHACNRPGARKWPRAT